MKTARQKAQEIVDLCDRVGVGTDDLYLYKTNLRTFIEQALLEAAKVEWPAKTVVYEALGTQPINEFTSEFGEGFNNGILACYDYLKSRLKKRGGVEI